MYQAYYHLSQRIHRKDRSGAELFISPSFSEAISRLEFIKDKGGIVVFTGPAGAGKSTVLRYFVEKLNQKFYKVAYAPLSTVSVIEFYRQIAYLLHGDIPFRKDQLFYSIQKTIIELATNQNTIPIVIFDDAQFMKNENFRELQLLTNFNFDSTDPVLFVLAAQPHLIDRLKRPAFESFYQRIKIKISLYPLTLKETESFISHVLKTASASETLFNNNAIQLIHSLTSGLPRKITQLMEQALIYGTAHQMNTIDENIILKIAKEI